MPQATICIILYIPDLSKKLNEYQISVYFGKQLINHLMYADDIVLISSSVKGLQKLLHVCERYGVDFDSIYSHGGCILIVHHHY